MNCKSSIKLISHDSLNVSIQSQIFLHLDNISGHCYGLVTFFVECEGMTLLRKVATSSVNPWMLLDGLSSLRIIVNTVDSHVLLNRSDHA